MKQEKPPVKDLIPLRKGTELLFQLTGVRRTKAAIYQWARLGRINEHGVKVKLKTYKRIGMLYTTEEAFREFIVGLG